ncbi:MAG: hypothetical protein V1787_03070 [Candidatus Micrarchaeota archaeon]
MSFLEQAKDFLRPTGWKLVISMGIWAISVFMLKISHYDLFVRGISDAVDFADIIKGNAIALIGYYLVVCILSFAKSKLMKK